MFRYLKSHNHLLSERKVQFDIAFNSSHWGISAELWHDMRSRTRVLHILILCFEFTFRWLKPGIKIADYLFVDDLLDTTVTTAFEKEDESK